MPVPERRIRVRKPRPKKGGQAGQQPFVATEAQRLAVAGLVSIGTERWCICEVLRISVSTLGKHFKKELAQGRAIVHARVGGGIAAQALSGDKTMMCFYAKAQMGWRERSETVTLGADGKPVDPAGPVTVVLVNYGTLAK